MKHCLAAILVFGFCAPAGAENFTTAAEVRPILQATKPHWIAVRQYEGRDLLYFTNLLAWRCGVEAIHYTVNGGEEAQFAAEPCYEDSAQPNALRAESLDAILVSFDPNTVQTVDLRVVFDDGSEETAQYTRETIEID
ncbi:hypothetical protein [Celeribacter arenosi]|uniref:Uncharacterized protein n=1 Tax=Celeribacter arenosi TaxID=792649 RepID=A0ABP7JTV1_9RHOB